MKKHETMKKIEGIISYRTLCRPTELVSLTNPNDNELAVLINRPAFSFFKKYKEETGENEISYGENITCDRVTLCITMEISIYTDL